jgi:hypothetical protein
LIGWGYVTTEFGVVSDDGDGDGDEAVIVSATELVNL